MEDLKKYFKVRLQDHNGENFWIMVKELGRAQAYYQAEYLCKMRGISFKPDNAYYPQHTLIQEIPQDEYMGKK